VAECEHANHYIADAVTSDLALPHDAMVIQSKMINIVIFNGTLYGDLLL
jgi:hypothetical protein